MVLIERERPALVAATAEPKIAIRDIRKSFTTPDGGAYQALDGVSFDVPAGGFVSVVGPSGCGKSTLLRLAAGLAKPDSGAVLIDGQPVTGVNPQVGFLFQHDALLPWRSVFDNIALGLRMRKRPAAEVRARVNEWIARVGLRGFEHYYPARLSGGMRKRVAIAQTLCYEPSIVLMDEPFTHLDVQTRHFIEEDLMRLCDDGQRTILFVTHDLDEAIGLADRVIVLTAGPGSRVRTDEEVGLPRPRQLHDVRTEPRFTALSRQLWGQLREEVTGAYGRE